MSLRLDNETTTSFTGPSFGIHADQLWWSGNIVASRALTLTAKIVVSLLVG
ncbi:uncharacterized protein PODANS_1_3560 [Podospora anserina S mat+]|uniref:Podospora anserina S mat+ genomic DNA chromosome 1, supercontig 1 n=2 Tax=Podospora TaxID=5144 RepID=B2AAC5_PODAN|nr:uncharacterized protein PODANS_1_3560 [Podospora anserina S mat+]CAP60037.1 unnamed protein product [Podospora anserina S mat+]CDP22678.1 Putative protein of unknown function [Podospora anserina S mat+]VBB71701.1 Putative protein of unknown function [Podospora comata]